jgi:hypothetical protein
MKIKMPTWLFSFRQPVILHSAATLVVLILWTGNLSAQFLAKPVNLAYLSQRADMIMQGRIIKVIEQPMPGYPNIPTVAITIAVDQSLRGSAGKTYTFREVLIGQRPKSSKRNYSAGQHFLLFLPTPSKFGLSSPIGLGQGRFRITDDTSGQMTVMNERNNVGLFQGVEKAARASGKQLTANQRRLASTEHGPVALDDFISLVKSLTTLPRIR